MTSFSAVEPNVEGVTAIFQKIADSYFNTRSILLLVISVLLAYLIGRLAAAILRRVVAAIGRQADKSEDLQTVNQLRRYETMIILSIAVIRTVLLLFALYFWWVSVRGDQQQAGVIGASALAVIIIGAVFTPLLRDISSGSIMMAEQWFAVGDYVRLEPFADMQGVVERVTLRSTRVRGLNGEVIWVNNQNIQAVRITPKGIRTLAVEVFVKDLKKGVELIESTNRRLPTGPLLVISPFSLMTTSQVGEKLWHLTAVAETAPGREWLIEKYAMEVMREIDQDDDGKLQNLATEPVARFADTDTERKFARAIHNASKSPRARKSHLKKLVEEAKKQQKGFAHPLMLMVIVMVVGVIGFAGYAVMSRQSGTTKKVSQTTEQSGSKKSCTANDKTVCAFIAAWDKQRQYQVKVSAKPADKAAYDATYQVDGDDNYSLEISGETPYRLIVASQSLYIQAADGAWWKQASNPELADGYRQSFDFDVNQTAGEDASSVGNTTYKRIGKEACGGLTCHKYLMTQTGATAAAEYIWFDDKDYLLRRVMSESGDSDAHISYDKVAISVPGDYKELGPNQYLMPGASQPTTMPDAGSYQDYLNSLPQAGAHTDPNAP